MGLSKPDFDLRSDQLAPHNLEMEQALLGAILADSEAIYSVLPIIKADDFFSFSHSLIWSAIVTLHERQTPIDALTLSGELGQQGRLAEVGGQAYINQLAHHTPSALNVEGYAHGIQQLSTRRRLLRASEQIARLAHSEVTDIDDVISQAEGVFLQVTERRLTRDLTPVGEIAARYFDHVSNLARHAETIMGVPTGFILLDQKLGGLQKSDLLIVAARPGMGKSSLLNSIVLNAAEKDERVAFFTLEMSSEQLVQRLVAMDARIPSHKLREGKLNDEDWTALIASVDRLSDLPLFFDDTPALSTQELRSKARRMHMEFGLNLIVVDYLQLMTTPGRSENRVQEISYISRALKQIARELNVPLIAAAQLSRAVEQRADKRPLLSDLRESGCLSGDALVYLPKRGYVPIRDLAGQTGFTITALDTHSWKLEQAAVTNAFCTGVKPVFKLQTALGRNIEATANHKFLTIEGWKRLDELTEGEHIAVPRHLPYSPQTTMSMTNDELALLAHLIGDGCTLPRHAIQYTTREPDLAEVVHKLGSSVFGNLIRPRIVQERKWYQVYLPAEASLTHNVHNPLASWLMELGVWGLRSHEKFVPSKVFQQPESAIALFLRHLWATDGCIRYSGKLVYPAVYYASSSDKLARDVQSLLLRLGINATLKQVPQNGKGRDQYHVYVRGADDLHLFCTKVGAVGAYKNTALDQVMHYLSATKPNTNRDIVPAKVWRQLVVPMMQQRSITGRELQKQINMSYCGTALYKQNMSRLRANKVAQIVNSQELMQLASSEVYWDQTISITPQGEKEVFDLTVPGPENFIANNIIVHNSIEQDADVVMFIYRDSYYNEDSPHGNKAEIHIGKHRNGPTGVVELIFLPELTQFQNAVLVSHDLDDF